MSTSTIAAAKPGTLACPALESGDRMDAAEFFWRYSLRADIKKAELIDGVVYVASPVNTRMHGSPHYILVGELYGYSKAANGVHGADNATIRIPPQSGAGRDNQPQPDILLYRDEENGGSARFDDDGWLISAPELVAEVAYSSRGYDLTVKKDLYRRIGVREYVVWQVEDGRIDWWQLVDGQYLPLVPDERGLLHSQVFPGLALDVPALLRQVPAAKLPRRPRRRPQTEAGS